MQPYSLDLRQRIIDTYADGNTSQRQLAQRFRVAPSFVQKILKQYRETGSIEPKQRSEQSPTKLNSAQLDILKNIVAANNDATLAELCDRLEQETNIRSGKRPSKRGKRVSIISAINLKEVMTHCQLIGTTDGLTFEAFISQRLVPKLWKGACVIMDNCSIHKGKEIKALIEAAGAILIYLPPYSPDFSPIENCFSKIKNILRSIGARTYLDLLKAIEEAFSQVSLQDLKGWFTHCCYCTSPA